MKFTEQYKKIMESSDDDATAQHVEKGQFQKAIDKLEDKIRDRKEFRYTDEDVEGFRKEIKKLKAAIGDKD